MKNTTMELPLSSAPWRVSVRGPAILFESDGCQPHILAKGKLIELDTTEGWNIFNGVQTLEANRGQDWLMAEITLSEGLK